MTITEISRTELRHCQVGTWYRIRRRYVPLDGSEHDYDQIELHPHADPDVVFALEYAVASHSARAEWEATGWYLVWPGCGGDPRFLHRRKEDAMREAEVYAAVLITGGDMSELRTGRRAQRNVECKNCGHHVNVAR
jgi:hypothetical protein